MQKTSANTTRRVIHLLIRLQELERRAKASDHGRLTRRERRLVHNYIGELKGAIPNHVVECYEQLRCSNEDLLKCSELRAALALLLASGKLEIRQRARWVFYSDSGRLRRSSTDGSNMKDSTRKRPVHRPL